MKKLMIAAAIVCAAVASQAASWDWGTVFKGEIYTAGGASKLTSGTAYIFALTDSSITQQDVLDAWAGKKTWTTGSLDDKSVTTGAIAASGAADFTYGGTSGNYDFFVALVDGDEMFLSDKFTGQAADISYVQMLPNFKAASSRALHETSTFSEGGWYTAVPEPTSGLLLLLGVAGLALRRGRRS